MAWPSTSPVSAPPQTQSSPPQPRQERTQSRTATPGASPSQMPEPQTRWKLGCPQNPLLLWLPRPLFPLHASVKWPPRRRQPQRQQQSHQPLQPPQPRRSQPPRLGAQALHPATNQRIWWHTSTRLVPHFPRNQLPLLPQNRPRHQHQQQPPPSQPSHPQPQKTLEQTDAVSVAALGISPLPHKCSQLRKRLRKHSLHLGKEARIRVALLPTLLPMLPLVCLVRGGSPSQTSLGKRSLLQ